MDGIRYINSELAKLERQKKELKKAYPMALDVDFCKRHLMVIEDKIREYEAELRNLEEN